MDGSLHQLLGRICAWAKHPSVHSLFLEWSMGARILVLEFNRIASRLRDETFGIGRYVSSSMERSHLA